MKQVSLQHTHTHTHTHKHNSPLNTHIHSHTHTHTYIHIHTYRDTISEKMHFFFLSFLLSTHLHLNSPHTLSFFLILFLTTIFFPSYYFWLLFFFRISGSIYQHKDSIEKYKGHSLWPSYRVSHFIREHGQTKIKVKIAEPGFYWRIKRDYSDVPNPYILYFDPKYDNLNKIQRDIKKIRKLKKVTRIVLHSSYAYPISPDRRKVHSQVCSLFFSNLQIFFVSSLFLCWIFISFFTFILSLMYSFSSCFCFFLRNSFSCCFYLF